MKIMRFTVLDYYFVCQCHVIVTQIAWVTSVGNFIPLLLGLDRVNISDCFIYSEFI
jgi:hypothetical protein